jgi:MFS transporter, DHA1 family, multidrug resistance protein
VLLLVTVAAGAGLVAVLVPLFVVVASRGLVSANATVLGIERSSAAGSASAVLGALMFAGGVLVTPLLAAGGEGTALPMAAVVAGGAVAALLATVLLARPAAKA